MRLFALLHYVTFLLLGALDQRDAREWCHSVYNDSVHIGFFKNMYDAKLLEAQVREKPPELDKSLSSIMDYFREISCGFMAVEPSSAIVNGTEAPDKAWPWQVMIHTIDSFCGGVLISDSWVLSAAHCFNESLTYEIEIGVRVIGPEGADSLFTRSTDHVIIHENYINTTWQNDLALVKLNASVYFSERVRPACLPFHRNDFNETDICYITGFGDGAPEIDEQTTLQQLRVHVVALKECLILYTALEMPIDFRRICVSGSGESGACSGDSGGPLSCKDGSKYYVVGVTSFGLSQCVSEVFPEVYTRVSENINWIFTVIKKYKLQ